MTYSHYHASKLSSAPELELFDASLGSELRHRGQQARRDGR